VCCGHVVCIPQQLCLKLYYDKFWLLKWTVLAMMMPVAYYHYMQTCRGGLLKHRAVYLISLHSFFWCVHLTRVSRMTLTCGFPLCCCPYSPNFAADFIITAQNIGMWVSCGTKKALVAAVRFWCMCFFWSMCDMYLKSHYPLIVDGGLVIL
jgi:hypothetical protein